MVRRMWFLDCLGRSKTEGLLNFLLFGGLSSVPPGTSGAKPGHLGVPKTTFRIPWQSVPNRDCPGKTGTVGHLALNRSSPKICGRDYVGYTYNLAICYSDWISGFVSAHARFCTSLFSRLCSVFGYCSRLQLRRAQPRTDFHAKLAESRSSEQGLFRVATLFFLILAPLYPLPLNHLGADCRLVFSPENRLMLKFSQQTTLNRRRNPIKVVLCIGKLGLWIPE